DPANARATATTRTPRAEAPREAWPVVRDRTARRAKRIAKVVEGRLMPSARFRTADRVRQHHRVPHRRDSVADVRLTSATASCGLSPARQRTTRAGCGRATSTLDS